MNTTLRLVLLAGAAWLVAAAADGPATTLPSEAPAQFHAVDTAFDYTRQDVMIPMRDGVHLKTVILIPRVGPARRDAPNAL